MLLRAGIAPAPTLDDPVQDGACARPLEPHLPSLPCFKLGQQGCSNGVRAEWGVSVLIIEPTEIQAYPKAPLGDDSEGCRYHSMVLIAGHVCP